MQSVRIKIELGRGGREVEGEETLGVSRTRPAIVQQENISPD